MKEVNIGLLGCGTVGTGVARLLLNNTDLISARVGARLNLKKVADVDITTDRGVAFPDGVWTTDADAVVRDPQIDIVVEMIGGKGIARDLMLKAIDHGKHIVTANKALLASHGNEIFQAAREKKVDIGFEASTGGCMPVIKTLRESLVGNRIQTMTGILNGTCNYILTKITAEGIPFEDALAGAQEKGYAEADPTLDVDGHDTAHKLAILSALAYGMPLNLDDIYVEGISGITPGDIRFAEEFGYRIKLLAISKNNGDSVEARVHPTMIPITNILSSVNGAVNALMINGDAVDDIMLYGYGAGMMPTGSAVVSDCVDIARNLISGRAGRVPYLSYQAENIRNIAITSIDAVMTRYYFRFSALDHPGVLSKISGILGEYDISIKTVQQKGRKTNGSVPLVMQTHLANEASVQKALKRIEELKVVSTKPVFIRIEDDTILE
ncbi:MAG: homoserine dehydrogenase [Deltaproteobacteria bacterium]|nr:MAG: homoserine dehydrogenase [Deltaproteobacteria bacterium]